jgi:hypothetical protein
MKTWSLLQQISFAYFVTWILLTAAILARHIKDAVKENYDFWVISEVFEVYFPFFIGSICRMTYIWMCLVIGMTSAAYLFDALKSQPIVLMVALAMIVVLGWRSRRFFMQLA